MANYGKICCGASASHLITPNLLLLLLQYVAVCFNTITREYHNTDIRCHIYYGNQLSASKGNIFTSTLDRVEFYACSGLGGFMLN